MFYLTGQIELGEGRKISVITVPSAKRWQDVVLGRMKWTTITIDKQVTKHTQNDSWCFKDFAAEFLLLSQITKKD